VPKYYYRCSSCHSESYFYHSISDKRTDCDECTAESTLVKLPSKFSLVRETSPEKKVGDLVKKSIKEFNDDLEEEKKSLRSQEWEKE